MSASAAASLLSRQLREIQVSRDLPGISCGLVNDGNIFEWDVMLMITDDCKYYGGETPPPFRPDACSLPRPCADVDARESAGGNFRARMIFPPTYPHMPPSFAFQRPVPFHPNIYPTGQLCISILHPPEEDEYGYEDASERWSPVQSPETILLSIISLFHSPNEESPANVEAARLLREEREGKHKEYRSRVRKCVRESLGED
ncbi:ubiquitin-conjugating enzyme E2 [Drechmeria coniospora]|uniref:Ubiquitin-conjugating enzyme E2 2 n=1 Tax=Drechmeria coniospora TaxID=98403 RepID=A0A151GQZ6_DRECN|nr:ubiquitin-conjugating enzyme E2 [Drechmeria coniospora]KYK59513.1 ubiquitin-conjugating enzyme E2 [Drechmeria coniospora]